VKKRDGKPFEFGVVGRDPREALGNQDFFPGNNSGEDGGRIMDFGSNCND